MTPASVTNRVGIPIPNPIPSAILFDVFAPPLLGLESPGDTDWILDTVVVEVEGTVVMVVRFGTVCGD
jgi:hypothetical protein